jgi:hypothetical protein
MNGITGITHCVTVDETSEGRRWYTALVGRAPDIEPVPGVLEWEILPGLWLQVSADGAGGADSQMLRIGVADIEDAAERLAAVGIDVGPIERVEGVVAYCEFADSSGNALSIYQEL